MMSELNNIDADQRAKIHVAVREFAMADENYKHAGNLRTEACVKLRPLLPDNTRFIVDVGLSVVLLVTVKQHSSFTVEPIEVI
jgi:hypothetical protein